MLLKRVAVVSLLNYCMSNSFVPVHIMASSWVSSMYYTIADNIEVMEIRPAMGTRLYYNSILIALKLILMLLHSGLQILLSLGCIVSASVCIWKLAVKEPTLDNSKRNIPGSTTNRSQDHNADIQHHLDRHQSQLLLSTQITAGWIIFTSIIVLLYQLFSVLQNLIISGLFCVSAIFLKIPVGIGLYMIIV